MPFLRNRLPSLWITWSFEEGCAHNLIEGMDGEPDFWQRFFKLRSARLVVLRAGDLAFLRAGTFHRVFTIEGKVVLYGELIHRGSFSDALQSIRRDDEGHGDHAPWHTVDPDLRIEQALLSGLLYEARQKESGAVARLLKLLLDDAEDPSASTGQCVGLCLDMVILISLVCVQYSSFLPLTDPPTHPFAHTGFLSLTCSCAFE